jgi:hypothetical protein
VPFEEADEPYFVGRERECDAIFHRLFACRLTIVYGTSGVGKSSILRAGVVKRIREHELSVPVLVKEWKGSALESIDRALDELGLDRRSEETLEQRLRRTVATLQRFIMIILDQFEDVVSNDRWTDSAAMAELFDAIAALSLRDGGVSFVVAIRADALADIDGLLRRVEGELTPESYRVEPMNKDGAGRAIREPVARYNEDHHASVTVEAELVDEVLAGVAEPALASPISVTRRSAESADLPFLQIVMQRIWESERLPPPSDTLRAKTLHDLGGTETIMREHVGRILGGLSERDQAMAARLLGLLITPTGAKVAYSTEDLAGLTGLRLDDVQRVVETLSRGESRLLHVAPASSTRVYELFHDRLIEPVSRWREEHHSRAIALQRKKDRRVIVAIAAVAAALVSVAVGLTVAWLASDDGPPQATIKEVTISGTDASGLQTTKLYDGDDNSPLIVPVGPSHQFKMQVVFPEETDIVDVQVIPSRDSNTTVPGPREAFIGETRIEVPVGDVRPVGRGAYGRTNQLTLIIVAADIDEEVQVAELKFWRHES